MRRAVTILLLGAAAAALAGAVALRSRVGHPVTARMQAEAGSMSGRQLPALGVAPPQAAVRLGDRSAPPRPTVLVFIQDGCPCSEAAEPCFRRLHAAYGDRVRLLGVIDGDARVARDWRDRHRTPYDVIADPERTVIRACGAERSAYTALVRPDGAIDRLWPGYSAGMLRELGARAAALSGTVEAPLDVAGAPTDLTSGCPF